MLVQELNNLTVLGAGVLGGQIAWQSAFKGKSVVVYDLHEEGLANCRTAMKEYAGIYQQDLQATESQIEATWTRLTFTTDLADSVVDADLVIEAVPEIPEVKTAVYRELSGYLPEHTLVATNSSTLLPSQFAEATGRAEQYCALHFANYIWSLNLAEVMAHSTTSEATLLAVSRFAIEIGMVPIPVEKEQNGYVLNTLLVPLLNAAQTLVTNGVATPEYVDRVHMIFNRGCTMGPFGIIDMVGMNTVFNVFSYWGNENNDEQMVKNAQYLKTRMIDKGLMGLRTAQGFYTYPNPSYAAADFIDVPDMAQAAEVARLSLPKH